MVFINYIINQLITKFTSFATLQGVNGWPLRVIAQYYQVVLNMAPLPWQKFIPKPFWTAQFKHKLMPAEPAAPPPSQKDQGAEPSQPPKSAASDQIDEPPVPAGHPETQPLEAAGAENVQGYCKSLLAHIDPQNSMAAIISQLKDMDLSSHVSDLERLGVILSQRLMLIEHAYAAQGETLKVLQQDAEEMAKEQDVLTGFKLSILAAQERIHAFLAKKKEEEEMEKAQEEEKKAQEELRKVKEQQADQILSQMEAMGLSPQTLLELHQKRQIDAQQPIPSEAASAESEPAVPNTKKARIEDAQDSSEMVEVEVEEEEPK